MDADSILSVQPHVSATGDSFPVPMPYRHGTTSGSFSGLGHSVLRDLVKCPELNGAEVTLAASIPPPGAPWQTSTALLIHMCQLIAFAKRYATRFYTPSQLCWLQFLKWRKTLPAIFIGIFKGKCLCPQIFVLLRR